MDRWRERETGSCVSGRRSCFSCGAEASKHSEMIHARGVMRGVFLVWGVASVARRLLVTLLDRMMIKCKYYLSERRCGLPLNFFFRSDLRSQASRRTNALKEGQRRHTNRRLARLIASAVIIVTEIYIYIYIFLYVNNANTFL